MKNITITFWFLLTTPALAQMSGRVLEFNGLYGYIGTATDTVFVHESGMVDEVWQGEAVNFETVESSKGLRAVLVRRKNQQI